VRLQLLHRPPVGLFFLGEFLEFVLVGLLRFDVDLSEKVSGHLVLAEVFHKNAFKNQDEIK